MRRLKAEAEQIDRQVLVTDARTGLRLGAQGDQHFRFLEGLGDQQFVRLEIGFSEYAELDALHSVLGERGPASWTRPPASPAYCSSTK